MLVNFEFRILTWNFEFWLNFKFRFSILEKKNLEMNWTKILKKKCWRQFWKKNFWKTMLEKSFDDPICALLASFDKTESNENVCGIWFKIDSVARSHWTQEMWRFERSREKRYNHGLRAVGNSLTTWVVSASSMVRNYSSELAPTIKRWALNMTRKSSIVYISCALVVRCWIYRC